MSVLAQEFWHDGKRVSRANVLFLGTGDREIVWHRIALDQGLVFWRVEQAPSLPSPDDDSTEFGQHPVVDLGKQYGLTGRRLTGVEAVAASDADELRIEFEHGYVLALRDIPGQDATDLEIRAPAA